MPEPSRSRSDHHRSSRGERDRSRSPRTRDEGRHRSSRNRDRSRSRSRSPHRRANHHSDDDDADADEHRRPPGVAEIGPDDFFIKATELKLWLWDVKAKKLDSLKNEDARRYFRKFCRAWNRGRLSDDYYSGISPASLPSSISTSHSWSFAKASQRDLDTAASVRKSIDTGSKERSYEAAPRASTSTSTVARSSSSSGGGGGGGGGGNNKVVVGPTLPPPASAGSAVERLQLERDGIDRARERDRSERDRERKKQSRESRQEEREGRATGRERLIEKRLEGNASRKAFEQSREGGGMVDVPEEVLMGSGSGSFQDAVKERERARQRKEGWRQGQMDEKRAVVSDKFSAYKQKEDATMAQFRALAAERFGAQQ